MEELLKTRVNQISTLAKITAYDSRSAYVAFTSGLRHHYTYFMRTIPGISSLLQPLEAVIQEELIPVLTAQDGFKRRKTSYVSLPRLGGMGLYHSFENIRARAPTFNYCYLKADSSHKGAISVAAT